MLLSISTEFASSLIWKPDGDVLIAEAVGYCCEPLYWIRPVEGGFVAEGRYADPGDPFREEQVFATPGAAMASIYQAWGRFRRTKFWDVIVTNDCYLEEKRKRYHEPGCRHAAKPKADGGVPPGGQVAL